MAKRIFLNQCCGVIIDVQPFLLKALESKLREQVEVNIMGFAKLLKYLRLPVLATVERPLEKKGSIAENIKRYLDNNDQAEVFGKDFFDLTKHKDITGYLRSTKRKQILVAGGETDVGVLQSCLGLMNLGYEIYLIEELLFSSSKNVGAAIERLRGEGATVLSLKTLYYELLEATEASPHRNKLSEKFGPLTLEL